MVWSYQCSIDIYLYSVCTQSALPHTIVCAHGDTLTGERPFHPGAWQWDAQRHQRSSQLCIRLSGLDVCSFLPVCGCCLYKGEDVMMSLYTDLDLLGWMGSCACWPASLHFSRDAFLYTFSVQLLCALNHIQIPYLHIFMLSFLCKQACSAAHLQITYMQIYNVQMRTKRIQKLRQKVIFSHKKSPFA